MKVLSWVALGCGLLAIALTGCLAEVLYSGDGRLIDHGPMAFDRRYVLDLGPVDLRKTGKIQYHIGKLPAVPFKVGLDVIFAQPLGTLYESSLSAIAAVVIIDSEGRTIFSDERPLKDWSWERLRSEEDVAHAFVWLPPRLGYASSFDGDHILSFAVVQSDTSTRDYAARLTVKGGVEGY